MLKKIFYFSGTHWDREWYQTFQGFRLNLVKTTGELINVLEKNPDFKVFHFDGQTIVLEDFIEVCPEQKERLKRLIAQRRILIGPWYCMPDEFLVSGESLIRNLQKGFEMSKEWGTKAWKCGYICDIFGHIAQMPQILRGFGIEYAALSRGINEHSCTPFFRWVSPDNSAVTAYKMPEKSGYGAFSMEVVGQRVHGECVPADSAEFREKARMYIDGQFARSDDIPIVMAMDGMDHEPIHKEALEYIAVLRQMYPDAEIVLDDMLAAFRAAEEYRDKMAVKQGELNETAKELGPHIHLLTHTLSSRHENKLRNDQCQAIMERWLEPMQLIYTAKGIGFCQNYLSVAWKHLLQNHPHDSICGCSVDRVHQEMNYRFSQVESIYEALMDDCERQLSKGLQIIDKEQKNNKMILVNPLPYARTADITVTLPFAPDYPTWCEPFGYQDIAAFKLYTADGTEVPYCIRSVYRDGCVRIHGEKTAKADLYTITCTVLLQAAGFTDLTIVAQNEPVRYFGTMVSPQGTLENDYLRVTVCDDGSINLLDKIGNKGYNNILSLTDAGELGDGWNSVSPCTDRVAVRTTLKGVMITADSPVYSEIKIVREMLIPKQMNYGAHGIERSDQYIPVLCECNIGLYRESRSLTVKLKINNTAADHKMTLVIPTDTDTAQYEVNQAFAFVQRACGINANSANWKEKDCLERATSGIVVKRSSDGTGLAFVSKGGIHECGVSDDLRKTMFITLFRAFGKTYTTNGEPDGQAQGDHEYNFQLVVLDESVTNTALQRMQDDWMTGVRAFVASQSIDSTLLSVEGDVCISALKPALDGSGDIILRVYNPSQQIQKAVIKGLSPTADISVCNLMEEKENPLTVKTDTVLFEVPPYKIVTLRISN